MKDASSACAAIRSASSEPEVISIVRGYFSSLSAEKVVLIPRDVIGVGVSHAREVARAAMEVARLEALAAADAPEVSLLREVGAVLSTAAMRLMVLATGVDSGAGPVGQK